MLRARSNEKECGLDMMLGTQMKYRLFICACLIGCIQGCDGCNPPNVSVYKYDCPQESTKRVKAGAECILSVDSDCDCYDNAESAPSEDLADCDDSDPNVHPYATEVCDTKDNDCDGVIDESEQYSDPVFDFEAFDIDIPCDGQPQRGFFVPSAIQACTALAIPYITRLPGVPYKIEIPDIDPDQGGVQVSAKYRVDWTVTCGIPNSQSIPILGLRVVLFEQRITNPDFSIDAWPMKISSNVYQCPGATEDDATPQSTPDVSYMNFADIHTLQPSSADVKLSWWLSLQDDAQPPLGTTPFSESAISAYWLMNSTPANPQVSDEEGISLQGNIYRFKTANSLIRPVCGSGCTQINNSQHSSSIATIQKLAWGSSSSTGRVATLFFPHYVGPDMKTDTTGTASQCPPFNDVNLPGNFCSLDGIVPDYEVTIVGEEEGSSEVKVTVDTYQKHLVGYTICLLVSQWTP